MSNKGVCFDIWRCCKTCWRHVRLLESKICDRHPQDSWQHLWLLEAEIPHVAAICQIHHSQGSLRKAFLGGFLP